MTNIKEVFSGCGERSKKNVNGPKKDEEICWSKLKGMGMMGGSMEVGTQLGIRVELIIGSPSDAY
jgi:hypothetical protein